MSGSRVVSRMHMVELPEVRRLKLLLAVTVLGLCYYFTAGWRRSDRASPDSNNGEPIALNYTA